MKTKGTETSAFGTSGRINHDNSKFYNSKLYSALEIKEVIDKSEKKLPDELLTYSPRLKAGDEPSKNRRL